MRSRTHIGGPALCRWISVRGLSRMAPNLRSGVPGRCHTPSLSPSELPDVLIGHRAGDVRVMLAGEVDEVPLIALEPPCPAAPPSLWPSCSPRDAN